MASSNFVNNILPALYVIAILFFSSSSVLSRPTIRNLPVPSLGPHNFAFDSLGRGPYTGVMDGRILMYQNSRNRFVDFAFTSPNRTRALCDGVKNLNLLSICGRPLSLAFFHRTRQLFIADATLGLFVVGRNGGRATQLATSADGIPFTFTVGLDVDQSSGNVYFTDASSTAGIDNVPLILSSRDSTGRLLKYDRRTKRVSVLLSGISGAAGVAISKDRSFLLVTEFVGSRIQKYWLRGPKANTAEVILHITAGIPDNIRRTESGDFWVALTSAKGELLGIRINGSGTILETLTFSPQFQAPTLAEVQQYKDTIYLGSLMGANVGVYQT